MLLAWIRPGCPRSPCRITPRRLESQVTNLMDMATRYGTRPRSRTMMVGRLRNRSWFLRSLASPPSCRGLEVHDLHRQTCAIRVPGGYEDPRRGPGVVRALLDRAVNVRTRGATSGRVRRGEVRGEWMADQRPEGRRAAVRPRRGFARRLCRGSYQDRRRAAPEHGSGRSGSRGPRYSRDRPAQAPLLVPR